MFTNGRQEFLFVNLEPFTPPMYKTTSQNQTIKYFILFTLNFFYVSVGFSQIKNVVLHNTGNRTAYFSYNNRFNDNISVTIQPKQSETLADLPPVVLRSSMGSRETFLFHSADSVNLSIDKDGRCTINSKASLPSNHVQLLKDIEGSLGLKKEREMLGNPLLRDSALSVCYQKELKYLTEYNKSQTLLNPFKDYLEKYFYYKYLMEKSKHLTLKSFAQNQIPKSYKDSLIGLSQFLNHDDCLNMEMYRRFALNYLDYLHFNLPANELLNHITKEFSGATKDFLLFSLLKNFSSSKPDLLNANYSRFLTACNDTTYTQYITNLYDFINIKPISSQKEILLTNGSILSFSDVIKKYQGRFIYIDFWASWCSPCVDEMPASSALAEKLIGKDVVFLYFSLDKNKNNWESAVKKLKLKPENNALLIGNFNSELAKRFKISSIPHYILIGKDGKVLNSNEARPSEAKLLLKINNLLKAR